MAAPAPAPARVLVIRNRFIGDTVLAVPALRNLRAAFPRARLDVLVEPGSGDVLGPCPYKDELLYWMPRQRRGTRPRPGVQVGLLGPARWLRARGYDRVYILRRSFSSALLTFLARIPHRVGFGTEGRAWLLSTSVPYADRHEAECFLDVLRADGIPILDRHNEGWTDPAAETKVAARFAPSARPQVLLCAKSTHPDRDWPPETFAATAAWLINARRCDVHICDAPGNAPFYESVRAALPPAAQRHWTDWSRELTLRESLALLRRLDLAVGIDTGLLHLCAMFHVPVVAMFGTVDPKRWHPWDTRHVIVRAPTDAAGVHRLGLLPLSAVQAAVDSLLPPPALPQPFPSP